MRHALSALAIVVFASTTAACGGKVLFETTGSGGAGGAASTTHGTGSPSVGTSVASGTSASGFPDGSTVGVGSSGSGFGSSGTGFGSSGSGMATSSSGFGSTGVASSSASGMMVGTVPCGGQMCNPGEICCFNPTGPGDHCGNSGQCDPGYVELSCNSPNDCPGSTCCATFDPMQQTYQGISCQASCNPQNQLVVCSQNNPGVCPPGTMCHNSMQLGQGYHVCF